MTVQKRAAYVLLTLEFPLNILSIELYLRTFYHQLISLIPIRIHLLMHLFIFFISPQMHILNHFLVLRRSMILLSYLNHWFFVRRMRIRFCRICLLRLSVLFILAHCFYYKLQQSQIIKFPDINQLMQDIPKPKEPSETDKLRARWNAMAPAYSSFDLTMQTFYYTLVNMLKMSQAKHVLEVACGIGKLIPHTATLKSNECTYLATDLSENMIEMAKAYIDNYLLKIGVDKSYEEWSKLHNIQFKVHNGQEAVEVPYKFDRIICNLVLMITENPQKMLTNLHSMAQQGCLLGVTIWGDKKLSNFMTLPQQAKIKLGMPLPSGRQNFHLFNKLEPIANQTGWQIVVQWQQSAPFNTFELNQGLGKIIQGQSQFNPKIVEWVQNKVKQTFSSKQVLNFPVQMAILRKK